MTAVQTDVEQIWQTLDALPSAGREIILARLANKSTRDSVFASPKTLLEDERFLISFEDYLALSDEEGEKLKLLAYEKYQHWIYDELASRRARWMLICGGKIIEWSSKLNEYPTREKRRALGRQMGYAPWTFIANPLIEESYWTAIPDNDDNDFYPSLSIAFGAENWNQEDIIKRGLKLDADFDTGSGNIMVDYSLLRSKNIIENQYGQDTESGKHLGLPYKCYVLPVQVVIIDETGEGISKIFSAYCVRDWQHSSFCLVNPVRKALLGRNLLYEFPLRVELDGGNRTTKILTASS